MLKVTLPPAGRQTAARDRPATVSPVTLVIPADPRVVPSASTIRYHGIPPPPRISWLAVLISAGLHAGLIVGFSKKSLPPRHIVIDDAPAEMLIMPELKDPEEDKIEELNEDEPFEAPSVAVPMLADIPINVPVDATFTQLVDYTIPLKTDPNATKLVSIPTNIQRGRPNDSAIKNLFNIADLDRRPEPISQTPPVFPYDQKKVTETAQVVVGFIITSKGDVIMPYVIRSTSRAFENSALTAVVRWKFRPGYRGGRKVNTRAEQLIDFKIVDNDS